MNSRFGFGTHQTLSTQSNLDVPRCDAATGATLAPVLCTVYPKACALQSPCWCWRD